VLWQKLATAVSTGRVQRTECQSLLERMFGAPHRHALDHLFDALEHARDQ
jgi:hypothetical protein